MRRGVAVGISVGVALIVSAAGFAAWKRVEGQAPANIEELKDARVEAKQLVPMCDAAESVKSQLVQGTSHFHEYDARKAQQVLADVVMPVIDARDLACSTAAKDLVQLQTLVPVEPFVTAGVPKVAAMQVKLERAKAAAAALKAALVANAAHPEVTAKIDALVASMN